MSPLISFIVFSLIAGILLWVLSQFPTIDGTVVKFIRIAVLVVLSILFINLVLVLLFGNGIPYYINGSSATTTPLLRR